MPLERLQKVLAARGIASRRRAEEMIAAGRVSVNGEIVREMGVKIEPAVDRIEVDGQVIPSAAPHSYLLLNKPPGYVTTVRDPHAPQTVMDLLGAFDRRVYPVGRLDRETRGVLLLTDDGDLAHALLHPSRSVEKVYEVVARGTLDAPSLAKLETGVELEDGPTAPSRVWAVERSGGRVRFRITLKEGRKRQVRRMVQAAGGRVEELRRISFGGLTAEGLPEGKWRALRPEEVEALRRAAGVSAGPESARRAKRRRNRR